VAHAVVGVPLGGVPERVVGLLQRRELGLRPGVVVEVRMVLPYLLAERILDLVLGGVLVDLHQFVEVLGHSTRASFREA
jgi:hypothetical protein